MRAYHQKKKLDKLKRAIRKSKKCFSEHFSSLLFEKTTLSFSRIALNDNV